MVQTYETESLAAETLCGSTPSVCEADFAFFDRAKESSPWGFPGPDCNVFTDASLQGWGGVCQSRSVGGLWDPKESQHINVLEMMAVLNVLIHFRDLLQVQHVLVRSDNATWWRISTTRVVCVQKHCKTCQQSCFCGANVTTSP